MSEQAMSEQAMSEQATGEQRSGNVAAWQRGTVGAIVGAAALIAHVIVLGGCARPAKVERHAAGATAQAGDGAVLGVRVLAGEQRQAAFDAARDVLRELRFELNRIDAREGVLTTAPKFTSGFATPWDIEQQTTRDELADLLHKHAREVRITFVLSGESVRMEVVAGVLRSQTPGQRLSTRAIALSSVAVDATPPQPQDVLAVGGGWAAHVVRRDDALAERIAMEVAERVAGEEVAE